MTTRPYELLARFGADGTISGVSTRTITTADGREYENNPVPLAGTSDPAFTAFATQFAASAVAEKETAVANLAAKTTAYDAEVAKVAALEAEKATLLSEKATLTATNQELRGDIADLDTALDQANATIEALQARIVELTPPEQPTSITKYQATRWLRDANLYDTVMIMLESNQDAKDRWTLSPILLRDDPIVESLGQALGLTIEQLDAAFLVASQIQ